MNRNRDGRVAGRGPLRILAFAYACEPDKGSEPGAGWMWARMLARLGETWVITRANNREAIEAALPSVPERDRLHFVFVDLPAWSRGWKRGQRGVRLYYLLWQLAALRRGNALHREIAFDLVWHLTLANAWLGSLAGFVGPPFVYGPVGGGVALPWRLFSCLGLRGGAYEVARSIARAIGRYVNPLARIGWRRANLILVQNPETREWLPKRHREKTVVFPHAVLDALPNPHSRGSFAGPTALFAGRLLPWKGGALAIRAISELPGWQLRVIGDGPDARRLRRLAKRLKVAERVDFTGWQSHGEVLRQMANEADVLFFPSLHDDSPFVVPEALSCGLPVLCVDRGGPPILASGAGRAARPRQDARSLASELADFARGLCGQAWNGRVEPVVLQDPRERAKDLLLDSRVGELAQLLRIAMDGGRFVGRKERVLA